MDRTAAAKMHVKVFDDVEGFTLKTFFSPAPLHFPSASAPLSLSLPLMLSYGLAAELITKAN